MRDAESMDKLHKIEAATVEMDRALHMLKFHVARAKRATVYNRMYTACEVDRILKQLAIIEENSIPRTPRRPLNI